MGRSTWQFILLTFTCAFSSCFAEVSLGVKVSPETVSFPHTATPQPHPRHHSSSHQRTTVHFNSTGSLKTTSMSQRTTVQSTDQSQVTTAPGHHMTDQAAATTTQVISQKSPMMVSTISADNTTAAGQTTTQAMKTVTLVVKNATIHPVSSTKQDRACVSTEITAAATNTTIKDTTPNTQMTATAINTTATTINTTATTMQTVKPTTGSGNQTLPESSIAPATTNATTIHPGTQTAIPSTMMTARPTLAPQPYPIPTGVYTISSGNRTCIKAVMGLQLMAQNAQKKQMEYMTVNPNVTQTFGSCGMVQSQLNITFSGGSVNFTFVKQAPSYYVSKIETRLQSSSEGMLYYGAIQEKMFTTKLGNSFKCASEQTFNLEKNFQLLFVNMQLQAFDIVGNQFGKGK
ncbi:lysosome-associated membrane glycoprotein 3 isoform X2 [Neopsephotus bourkii]|uniref:lysosome-associated membrane glycoprotein 3 isoform X2 n=1 Tax=Neopsephotus bourkii TaxID=309878 RepID=UPI002AA5364B|nr:lysosome-associated membrane glycoprotein 3 isoform X2 [Neopsephotus bourkii]